MSQFKQTLFQAFCKEVVIYVFDSICIVYMQSGNCCWAPHVDRQWRAVLPLNIWISTMF
jgi:hypothetical protein